MGWDARWGEKRGNGFARNALQTLEARFEIHRKMPLFDSYERAGPKIQLSGNNAVLSYFLVRQVGDAVSL
jgi:hypothetical protein